jgi:hypothetical protein
MNNAPRNSLRQIIAKYGNDLCGDARRCENLLKDLSGEYRREINVLISALEERVPLDLLAAGKSLPRELLLNKLAKRLEDNLGLTKEAANWAVDSWALALGVATDLEIEEKEQNRREASARDFPTSQDSKTKTVNDSGARANPPNPAPRTPPKPKPPAIYPPIAKTPANPPVPLPKSPPQTKGATVNAPQNPAQTAVQPLNPAPRKRFGKFFGCLFVIIFLFLSGIVLLFGVPYAINVMRETQQSEPPRFPPR